MALTSFLFFQSKTDFNVNTLHVISNISQLLPPLFDVDHLEIANCSNLTIVFYSLGNFGQALCIRSCHEDLILTRKSHNCAGIAFIQGESAGGSKLIEQTSKCLSVMQYKICWPRANKTTLDSRGPWLYASRRTCHRRSQLLTAI